MKVEAYYEAPTRSLDQHAAYLNCLRTRGITRADNCTGGHSTHNCARCTDGRSGPGATRRNAECNSRLTRSASACFWWPNESADDLAQATEHATEFNESSQRLAAIGITDHSTGSI
jgi:hypothetical protein